MCCEGLDCAINTRQGKPILVKWLSEQLSFLTAADLSSRLEFVPAPLKPEGELLLISVEAEAGPFNGGGSSAASNSVI